MTAMSALQQVQDVFGASRERMAHAVEKNGVEPVLDMLESARRDLSIELLKLAKQGKLGRFTYIMKKQAEIQINGMIKTLEKNINKHGLKNMNDMSDMAYHDTIENLSRLDKLFTGVVTPLSIEEAGYLDYIRGKTSGSLMRGFQNSVRRYGLENIGNFERIMRQGLLQKKDPFTVMHEIAGEMGGMKQSSYKAERIVRTELVNAYNTSSATSIKESRKSLPDLKNQWIAHIDDRTCPACRNLHLQIHNIGAPFTGRIGKRIVTVSHPTIHPNCRCTIVPYRDAWR